MNFVFVIWCPEAYNNFYIFLRIQFDDIFKFNDNQFSDCQFFFLQLYDFDKWIGHYVKKKYYSNFWQTLIFTCLHLWYGAPEACNNFYTLLTIQFIRWFFSNWMTIHLVIVNLLLSSTIWFWQMDWAFCKKMHCYCNFWYTVIKFICLYLWYGASEV